MPPDAQNSNFSSQFAFEKRSNLVAIIGNDGAGKTTQAHRLLDWLTSQGHAATLHPNESLQPLKMALGGIAFQMGCASPEALVGLEASQLAYAAIKWNAMLKMRDALAEEGRFIIIDRYSYCHIASVRSQGLHNADIIERLFAIFPKPDLTIFIDISPETAIQRMIARGVDAVPQSRAYLEGHACAYRQLSEASDFVFVAGERSIDEIASDIQAHMRQQFKL